MTYYHPHLVVAIVLELRKGKALSLLRGQRECCRRRHRGRGRRPAAQNQRARGSRHRWRQGAADKDDDDDDGARSSDRPRSSPTGGGVLLCRRWTVVCPPRLAVASGPFHTAIVDLNIRARRRSRRLEARIGRRCRNAIMTEGAAAAESTDNILVDDERCDGRGQHWLCRLRGRLTT